MRLAGLLASMALTTAAFAGPPASPAPAAPSAPMAPGAPVMGTSPGDTQYNKPPSLKSCKKAADQQGLTGNDKTTFVKDCLAGNTPPPEDD